MKKEYVEIYIEFSKKDIKLVELSYNGIRFCPQIRLEDEGDIKPNWTVEIIIRESRNNFSFYADLRYLSENAPKELLKKGKEFILFDGPNQIAKGEILTDLISMQ